MDNGTWTTLNMTDPTTTVINNDLSPWPMIRSNSRTLNEDEMATNINTIWTNREVLATQMVNEAITNNYTGYCMDIEFQTSRASTRDKCMQLVNFFAEKLHQSNKKLMVAHAHWATMAPMSSLKNTSVDYVATMDPYTASDLFFKKNGDETQGQAYEDYNQLEHNRLIWRLLGNITQSQHKTQCGVGFKQMDITRMLLELQYGEHLQKTVVNQVVTHQLKV